MYLKWIVCEVSEDQKDSFSKAQEKWAEIKTVKGFIGQIGGWNQQKPSEACIVSFWENKESLEFFMENIHDDIFIASKQEQTYKSISVKHFEKISFEIEKLKSLIKNAEVLSDVVNTQGKEIKLVKSWKVLSQLK